jgi:hypothetical protein
MERQYVGIDLHRRRSVIVRKDDTGEQLGVVRIDNDRVRLAEEVSKAGDDTDVNLEATYGWYWTVDVLDELGCRVHLANPSGLNWGQRRVKNDVGDATDLIDLFRVGRLPEAWIAPPPVREQRELVRYRCKLVRLRSGLKAQVHAVMAKHDVLPARTDMFGQGGLAQLDALDLPAAYTTRIDSLRRLIVAYDREIRMVERLMHHTVKTDPGYVTLQTLPTSRTRIRHGADANEIGLGRWDWSLLHLAIDAEVDAATQDGTPLRVDITQMLVAAGANPNHGRSTRGETALDMARRRRHYLAVEALEPITGVGPTEHS